MQQPSNQLVNQLVCLYLLNNYISHLYQLQVRFDTRGNLYNNSRICTKQKNTTSMSAENAWRFSIVLVLRTMRKGQCLQFVAYNKKYDTLKHVACIHHKLEAHLRWTSFNTWIKRGKTNKLKKQTKKKRKFKRVTSWTKQCLLNSQGVKRHTYHWSVFRRNAFSNEPLH